MNSRSRFARAAGAVAVVVLPILVATAAASARGGKSKNAARDFEYAVSDCLGAGHKDTVGFEVSESSVRFNQILTINCIAATRPSTVKVSYSKKGRELEVSVILRSDVFSDCTCPIGIDGKISNLGKGAHRLSFIFDHKPGNGANEKAVRQALGSKEFSIE